MIHRFVIEFLPWALSAITIMMTLMAGNRHRYAWAVGLFGQFGWLAWIIATATWGFLPMNAAMWIVYGRNHLKWHRESNAQGGSDAGR